MATTRERGARAPLKPTLTNTTSASHVNDTSEKRRADGASRKAGPPDAEPQLQAAALPVGHRLLAPPAADPLDARGDPARRGLQGLEHAAHGRRAEPVDASVSLLHAVGRRGAGQLHGALRARVPPDRDQDDA